jgi:PEGA domain
MMEVISTPSKAKVFLNGKLMGVTPSKRKGVAAGLVLSVTLGSYTIRVEKEGYEPKELTVQAHAKETQKVIAKLERPTLDYDDLSMTDGVSGRLLRQVQR